ncbi:MAG: sulfur carrier protein ThiS [Deltaproteobacteria bacterium]|nr:sulfur carrier protein ThiS [Deltaproteobacteria bacterium]
MIVRVNGDEKEVIEGITLEGLLNLLEIKLQGIAIDINREIVPKRLYKDTVLKSGDSIEIVRMVGGG